ncbi:MAG: enoyl-CoA hydratase/isomerase family protein [Candidatus Methylomirabilis sp.]|nr:enoyl-CoA hydratase/isomerase family protein [Deltaproteobacteria bacterium]
MHAEIVLAGPRKNAMSSEMLRFLLERLREAGGAPALVRGEGDALSSGLDLREVASFRGEAEAFAFLKLLEDVFVAYYRHPAPVVACVNGHAIAGGCVIALCADWRVAQANPAIKIGLNEVARGIRFPPRTLALVADRLPLRHREEVILGAGLYAPADALRLGMVDEVSDDALGAARRKMEVLSALPRDAYAAVKTDLRKALPYDAEAERLLREAMPFWTSDAFRPRLAAALRK